MLLCRWKYSHNWSLAKEDMVHEFENVGKCGEMTRDSPINQLDLDQSDLPLLLHNWGRLNKRGSDFHELLMPKLVLPESSEVGGGVT